VDDGSGKSDPPLRFHIEIFDVRGCAARIEPRTGVPQRVVGHVLAVADDSLVVDAGIPLVVVAGGGGARATVGDVVEVDVDVDAGVGCALAD
jgi:hypothetical protein